MRLHGGIGSVGLSGTATEVFDMQFGEDAGAWCTQNQEALALGALRLIARNSA